MRGEEIIAALKDFLSDDIIIVSSNGNVSRQVFHLLPKPQVYLRGSMGLPMSVGLGLALSQVDKQVLVITGDGNFLMGLSSMTTIGNILPKNLKILIIDNKTYATTGGQETVSSSLDYPKLLEGLGVKHFDSFDPNEGSSKLKELVSTFLKSEDTFVLHLLADEDIQKLDNIPWHPIEIKTKFMERFV